MKSSVMGVTWILTPVLTEPEGLNAPVVTWLGPSWIAPSRPLRLEGHFPHWLVVQQLPEAVFSQGTRGESQSHTKETCPSLQPDGKT